MWNALLILIKIKHKKKYIKMGCGDSKNVGKPKDPNFDLIMDPDLEKN
jgi:hypothetical protein